MNLLTLLGISIGLAMDAFAVSVAAGLTLTSVTPRHVFRLAFHFGLFQFLMPILGWLAGKELAESISAYDHWVAFGLLACVGGKMLLDARHDEKTCSGEDPTRGLTLVALSVATSLDALAVGLSMAFLGVSVWFPAVVIGLVAALLSALGIGLGSRIQLRWAKYARAIGGIALLLVGGGILTSQLLGN
jgi:manganese efflux pump family protein